MGVQNGLKKLQSYGDIKVVKQIQELEQQT